MMAPFQCWRDLLTTAPGLGPLSAAAVISEIGAEVRAYFPDAAHLASWTGLCPGNHESAGKRRSGKRRKDNPHLQSILVECAWSAVRHDGYLKSLTTGTSSNGAATAARSPRIKPSSSSPMP
jgi:transposase